MYNVTSLMLVLLLVTGMAYAGDSPDHLQGEIIAYRSADMIYQVASEVLNKEVFLFRVSDPKAKIIKLIYEHYGYTNIGADILAKRPMIRVTVRRDKKCDEKYGSYIKNAPAVYDQFGKDIMRPIEFIGKNDELELSADKRLECYRVEHNDIYVIENQ